jgi:AcrR family transcriptional regulator
VNAKGLKMRKVVRPILPGAIFILICAAAHAQPAQPQTGHEERCRAYALQYLGPSPDKIHLTVRQEAEAGYEQARKYLRLCGDLDNGDTRRAEEQVAGHAVAKSIDRLLDAARNPGGAAARDPETYAAVAAAYDVRYKRLVSSVEQTSAEPSSKAAAKKEADDLAELLVDLYARAVAACGADAQCVEPKAAWVERLNEIYKRRHEGSDVGLRERIAGAPAKPLPQQWLQVWIANSL